MKKKNNPSLIKGLGTDIIEIKRIEQSIKNHGDAFIQKILTEKEREYCFKYTPPFASIAGRFAAKEATAKALGCGFGKIFSFYDCQIVNDPMGKPKIELSEKIHQLFSITNLHLSISHCKSYAVATVILE